LPAALPYVLLGLILAAFLISLDNLRAVFHPAALD